MYDAYPEKDFPWNFYFNGIAMPKWGACWGLAQLGNFLDSTPEWDADVSHRDIHIIACQIDHVGVIESADPEVFLYAIQEIIQILLTRKSDILTGLTNSESQEIYEGLLEAAFQMRGLVIEQKCAFWTSGYEPDLERLVETMRQCQRSQDDAQYSPPPHLQRLKGTLQSLQTTQIRHLHQLAQSGQLEKSLRRRLNEMGKP